MPAEPEELVEGARSALRLIEESSRTSLRAALVAEVLEQFGAARVRAFGSSMLPTVWAGDELVVRRQATEAVRRGDLVLFRRDGRLFAHRVVGACGTALVTKGDALAEPDPPLATTEVLGRVQEINRDGRRIRLDSLRQRLWAHLAPWVGVVLPLTPRTVRTAARRWVLSAENSLAA